MSAQTLRSPDDPRNYAPTVGTGGPVGGPTGLFTIYDGTTLRRGEYTFSAAYSNFDRDPGNVDITEIPISFQIGLSDNLELFFNTDAYRQIKVNSRQNLSSFYLPNSQLNVAALGGILAVPGAVVLAPQGPNANGLTNTAVYRRAGAPFVQFPFVGGPFGNNGFTAIGNFPTPSIGPSFGFPVGTPVTYGAPVGSGGGAANFPGLGSVYGSILPGIVLNVQTINLGGTPATNTTAPAVYTTSPTYLPDAPFINRSYAQTAFSTFTAGAKYRITDVKNPVGLALVGFYRWYADTASTTAGFNQLQRGASPGGNRGDFGLVLVADARLRKWLNLSGNLGYIYNSSVKGNFPSGTFTILDRPDELQYGVGLDFPTNQYFQPILEFRGTRYVGGRTPNAFENNPQDGIAGLRVYPKRWFGFGVAYRYNFNQQDADSIDGVTNSQNVGVVRVVTNTAAGAVFSTQTIASSTPLTNSNFGISSDPHGYIFQTWIGRRNSRAPKPVPNVPANVNDVALDSTTLTLPCPPGNTSTNPACNDDLTVGVKTAASDVENDVLTYNYTVSGGRIVGQGANVNWDLSGVRAGTYTITSAVDDGCGFCGKTVTKTITVAACTSCVPPPPKCECPTLSVSGPSDLVAIGQTGSFTANVSGGSQNGQTYNWSVSAGTITSGQGTPAITVSADAGASVTATVEIGGLCAECQKTASATANWANLPPKPLSNKIDEFGAAKPDEIKAKLDALFIALNNDPNAQGFIINYGTPKEIAARVKAIKAAIKFRNFAENRITFVDGGAGSGLNTQLWVVPQGADAPTP